MRTAKDQSTGHRPIMPQPAIVEPPASITTTPPGPVHDLHRRRAAPVRLFSAVFWVYTALCVTWLLIGLLPAILATGDLSFRQMLDVAPDAPGLRSIWTGLYLSSLRAEPPLALFMQYAFSALNIALGIVLYRSRPWDWTARMLGLGLVGTAAIFNYQAHSTLELMGPLVTTIHEFLHIFSGSMYLIALVIFPDGRMPQVLHRQWQPPKLVGQILGPLAIFGLILACSAA